MEAWKRGWVEKQQYLKERERKRRACGSEHRWSEWSFYTHKTAGEEWIRTCSDCGRIGRVLRPRAGEC